MAECSGLNRKDISTHPSCSRGGGKDSGATDSRRATHAAYLARNRPALTPAAAVAVCNGPVRSQGQGGACGPYPLLLKYCLLGPEGRTIIVYSCVPMSAHQAPKDVPNPWPYRRSCLNLVSLETITVINVGRFVRSKRGGKESTRGGEEVKVIKMYFTHASNCQK